MTDQHPGKECCESCMQDREFDPSYFDSTYCCCEALDGHGKVVIPLADGEYA